MFFLGFFLGGGGDPENLLIFFQTNISCESLAIPTLYNIPINLFDRLQKNTIIDNMLKIYIFKKDEIQDYKN